MLDTNVSLPSKPRVVSEEEFRGIYEIDGLYPGYGHTLGNSLRRIILSSLPGAAITQVKIDGVGHEFEAVDHIKEDVITILLNLKRIRIASHSAEPLTMTLKASGEGIITAGDITVPSQIEILNPEQPIAEITAKSGSLEIEMTVEHGLGYVPREIHQRDKVDIGTIALDAVFTPIRRVNYEVENMRVGDRTDYNRLRIVLETDGTVSPREALEQSIEIMIHQLKSVIGFQEEREEEVAETTDAPSEDEDESVDTDALKTRIETLDLSTRTANALEEASIRTVGGLVRKKKDDILALDGIGDKGLDEIEVVLKTLGLSLKD
ncbi:DNA-directed RNA polymerase subunit alpha [Candidatus Parcubacteria bacterium]|uniref:DNA-directed RNA polymerase subunit alpha n=1 Tax=Candidatus Kaiserbacteria bacterium CG10_big_fil_rev_8_21_14_0_10_47_16 TaxID=1974608 RepID=A0A2H0UEB2_9BACT|nr:DNA-directed RNA polymerase subunit alpha [Candidatus Parcubacteria bacterium]PIR84768.1 MAG: DNA-directed RNA polymerase subunit alpha [Candidatus Kaiserbacteria bacterium CG10_big_fil_rev_8_21_14_0_10_47_16]